MIVSVTNAKLIAVAGRCIRCIFVFGYWLFSLWVRFYSSYYRICFTLRCSEWVEDLRDESHVVWLFPIVIVEMFETFLIVHRRSVERWIVSEWHRDRLWDCINCRLFWLWELLACSVLMDTVYSFSWECQKIFSIFLYIKINSFVLLFCSFMVVATKTYNLYIVWIESIRFASGFWFYMIEVVSPRSGERLAAYLALMGSFTPYFRKKISLRSFRFYSVLFLFTDFWYRFSLLRCCNSWRELESRFPVLLWEIWEDFWEH